MKLARLLSFILVITVFALFYVWQQTEIFRLAYMGQKNVAVFEDLLDKNSVLRYNIGKNVSLVRIGNKISPGQDFQMPDAYRLVKLEASRPAARVIPQAAKKENILVRVFSVKRQAEAKTIAP